MIDSNRSREGDAEVAASKKKGIQWQEVLLYSVMGLAVLLVLAIVLGGPFFLEHEPFAQLLGGVLATVVATLLSVAATYSSAKRSAKEELTRYGLQAWRNLNSLQRKVVRQYEARSSAGTGQLFEWLLDLDDAKWAWQDYVREILHVQARLQKETKELVADYRDEFAKSPLEDLPSVRARRNARIDALAAGSPLPLRVPNEVTCPDCRSKIEVIISGSVGDTCAVRCRVCHRRLEVVRLGPEAIRLERVAEDTLGPTLLRLIRPREHLRGMKAAARIFAESPENRLAGWPDFKAKIRTALADLGVDPEYNRRLHKVLFLLKLFKLFGPGNGVGIDVPPDALIDSFEERLLQRLPAVPTAPELNSLFYGDDVERMPQLEALVAREAARRKAG